MKEAGIREARQNLTALLEEVRKGYEITITDRGRPVARLVPPRSPYRRRSRPMPKGSRGSSAKRRFSLR
jgi:prevent-host-death family protein